MIQVKSREIFSQWLDALRDHRQYRQQQLSNANQSISSPTISPGTRDDTSPNGIHVGLPRFDAVDNVPPMSREGSLPRNLKPSRAAGLISESSVALEQLNHELLHAQDRLHHLRKLAETWPSPDNHSVAGNISPAGKKDRKKFVLRRKKNKSTSSISEAPASTSESEAGTVAISSASSLQYWSNNRFICRSILVGVQSHLEKHSPLSCSIPSLSPSVNGSVVSEMISPASDQSGTLEPAQDFFNAGQDLIRSLTSALRVLNHEKERLKLVVETLAETTSISSRNGGTMGNLVGD